MFVLIARSLCSTNLRGGCDSPETLHNSNLMACAKACAANGLSSDALGGCLRACTAVADEVYDAEFQSTQGNLLALGAAAQLTIGVLNPSFPSTPPHWGSPSNVNVYSTPSYPTLVHRK